MKHKGKTIMAALLCVLALFGIGVCAVCYKHEKADPPTCGGTTDNSDSNAPKVINSKEISLFSTRFCLLGEWTPGKENHTYTFEVRPDDNGQLTASERSLKISVPADKALLEKLQIIIDEQKLAGMNGVSKVTAGLPAEYQPCSLSVTYASGEKLNFTKNNDPRAEWAKKMYLTFADWFASHGNKTLLPPQHKGQVESITITLTENDIYNDYGAHQVQEKDAINGEVHLLGKDVFDNKAKKNIEKKRILFPKDYYEKITAIVSAHDLRPFDHSSVLYGSGRVSPDQDAPDNAKLFIHIDYKDAPNLHITTSDPRDIEMLRPLLNDLFKYYDSIFGKD